mmetsp:Transcript_702/g.1558  ORF Transcript_702/g.1558 Transcript_702/m.1558 type:complete len:253 (-) Transcript_702:604-1362(-)
MRNDAKTALNLNDPPQIFREDTAATLSGPEQPRLLVSPCTLTPPAHIFLFDLWNFGRWVSSSCWPRPLRRVTGQEMVHTPLQFAVTTQTDPFVQITILRHVQTTCRDKLVRHLPVLNTSRHRAHGLAQTTPCAFVLDDLRDVSYTVKVNRLIGIVIASHVAPPTVDTHIRVDNSNDLLLARKVVVEPGKFLVCVSDDGLDVGDRHILGLDLQIRSDLTDRPGLRWVSCLPEFLPGSGLVPLERPKSRQLLDV